MNARKAKLLILINYGKTVKITLLFSPAVPPESFGGEAQAGGQKGRGLGGRNFCPPASVPVPFEQRKSGRGVWGEFRFSFAKSNCGQPRHLPEYLEGRTPQKNTLFIKRKRNRGRAKWKEQRVFFCGVASLSSSGGAGFLIGGFAQKMFELRPKNTAKFYIQRNWKMLPRRKAPRHGIFPQFWRHFWNPKPKCGRQCGSSQSEALAKWNFANQSFFFRFQRKVERIFLWLPKN